MFPSFEKIKHQQSNSKLGRNSTPEPRTSLFLIRTLHKTLFEISVNEQERTVHGFDFNHNPKTSLYLLARQGNLPKLLESLSSRQNPVYALLAHLYYRFLLRCDVQKNIEYYFFLSPLCRAEKIIQCSGLGDSWDKALYYKIRQYGLVLAFLPLCMGLYDKPGPL